LRGNGKPNVQSAKKKRKKGELQAQHSRREEHAVSICGAQKAAVLVWPGKFPTCLQIRTGPFGKKRRERTGDANMRRGVVVGPTLPGHSGLSEENRKKASTRKSRPTGRAGAELRATCFPHDCLEGSQANGTLNRRRSPASRTVVEETLRLAVRKIKKTTTSEELEKARDRKKGGDSKREPKKRNNQARIPPIKP